MNEPTIPTPTAEKPKYRSSILIAIVAIIIAIGSLLAQLIFWQLHRQEEIELVRHTQQQWQPLLLRLQEDLKQQQLNMAKLQSELQMQTKKSLELLQAEVEYLVNLAYYDLIFLNNVDIAIKSLERADEKLQQANDPSFLEVRKLIAQDITALKMAPKVDVTGLVLRLSSLSDQVKTLPLIPAQPSLEEKKVTPQKNLSFWEKFKASLEQIRGMIVIRRVEEPVKPALSPEQQFYLIANIRSQFDKAQWAVLHQDEQLYQESLKQANRLLQSNFQQNDQVINMQRLLLQLQKIDIKPNLPDLSRTLTALRHIQLNKSGATQENKPTASVVTPDPTPSSSRALSL